MAASSVRFGASRSVASSSAGGFRRLKSQIIRSPSDRFLSTQPSSHEPQRLVVAMSGGVDSSVAAHLLRQSHPTADLIGLHMSNWDASDEDGGDGGAGGKDGSGKTGTSTFCVQSEKEASDAQEVCDALRMPLHRASFAAEYWTGVFEPFVEGIDQGRMPNPDVGCNSIVKFGAMRDYALDRLRADWIATGHYARLWHRDAFASMDLLARSEMPDYLEEATADAPERDWIATWGMQVDGADSSAAAAPSLLLAGADLSKDQSYFLCGVNGHAFRNVLFPLGDLLKKTKDDENNNNKDDGTKSHNNDNKSVRDIANEAGLPTATKRESMGICFIGKRNFQSFISQYLPSMPQPGNFVDVDTGETVGTHEGASHFTIGQGAKISGASRKWFIVGRAEKNNDEGTVFVCGDTHHPALYSNELYIDANEFNWIGGTLPPPIAGGERLPALCRTRHLQPLIQCTVEIERAHGSSRIIIRFDSPVRAITPGQTAAVYVGGGLICLGGGQIASAGPSFHQLGLELPRMLHPAGQNDLSAARRASGI